MKQSWLLIVVSLTLINMYCSNDSPITTKNHSPVIFTLIAFPDEVSPSDSLIVICNAFDPDGDSLVYDWYTSGVVRIKGAFPGLPVLLNTFENSRIFYAPDSVHVAVPQDTFKVECAVRDRKGDQDVKSINFIVKRD